MPHQQACLASPTAQHACMNTSVCHPSVPALSAIKNATTCRQTPQCSCPMLAYAQIIIIHDETMTHMTTSALQAPVHRPHHPAAHGGLRAGPGLLLQQLRQGLCGPWPAGLGQRAPGAPVSRHQRLRAALGAPLLHGPSLAELPSLIPGARAETPAAKAALALAPGRLVGPASERCSCCCATPTAGMAEQACSVSSSGLLRR